MGAKPSSSSTSSRRSSSSTSSRRRFSLSNTSVSSSSYTPILVPSSWGLRMFSLAEIKNATNNFDESLLLRRGWMSEVYKGTYEDYDGKQRSITIKIFKLESLWTSWSTFQQKYDERWKLWFVKRLEAWSQFHHKNLVLMIGYCHEFSKYILVYEHMENGNLAQHLCKKITPTSFSLSWEQCLQICIDAAHGLEYIHKNIKLENGSRVSLGDVTATNILLDDNGVAKISDLFFEPVTKELNYEEIASSFDPQTHCSTGESYLSSDVYAFGVLLVKVLSRKVTFDKEDRNLGIWFNSCILDGTIKDQIIHPEMKVEISPDTLTALIDIIGECLNSEWQKRPSITQLVKKLELLMVCFPRLPCHQYSLQEINDITDSFTSVIGRGGEGTVYKGVTKTNTRIAVKHLKSEVSSEFEKEIKMLSNLGHLNLVSLIGYCHESDQKYLIYEFMSNGNLAQSLYNTANPLSLTQCLNICIGAARGLRYLHTRTNISQKGIIHRDVKPVNILLDENFNAKICDFGLSKVGPPHQGKSEVTTKLKGTVGYYAPEYLRYGKITRKIDVYAFGLVLSEVLCRNKPWDRDESFYITSNVEYAQWAKGDINPYLKELIAPCCLELFVGMLEKCLNIDPEKRPSMNEVVHILEYALKWQEIWQRQKSGGNFCLPGVENRPILYCTLNSKRSIRARMFMRRYSKFVDERDLANDLCLMDLKHALGNNADIDEPQLFFQGKHVGGTNEIVKLHAARELEEQLGQFSLLICDSCQHAWACDVCSQIYWYVHCNNCGALTVIRKEWEGRLRTCFECNANQLICDSITYSRNTYATSRRLRI